MNIAVIGGDLRQCYLAEVLSKAGHKIRAYDVADVETGSRCAKESGMKICDTVV